MTISAENLAEVKRVMARYHRIELTSKDQSSDIWKKRFEDLSLKLKASMNDASINGTKVVELTEANEDLKAQLKAAYIECDEKKKSWEEIQNLYKKLEQDHNELQKENMTLRRANETLGEAIEPAVNADQEALLWKISLLEQELKDKDEMITVLKQIVFKSLAKGGE